MGVKMAQDANGEAMSRDVGKFMGTRKSGWLVG